MRSRPGCVMPWRDTLFRHDAKGSYIGAIRHLWAASTNPSAIPYTAQGDVAEVIHADGRRAVMRYDDRGNLVYSRDEAGQTITQTFDSAQPLADQDGLPGGRSG